MKFIEVTNDAGAALEIPDSQVHFIMKLPMQREYILGVTGAVMKVNGAVLPFEIFQNSLLESDSEFIVFPIPEGTDAVINPSKVLFITSIEINVTAIMFPGAAKCMVAEGINSVRNKLTGQSAILNG